MKQIEHLIVLKLVEFLDRQQLNGIDPQGLEVVQLLHQTQVCPCKVVAGWGAALYQLSVAVR